jgi:DNA invertase Pin-like site-specific DNA recombinase
MTAFAYLRVSTDQQDVNNQRYGILEYSNSLNLGSLHFVEDAVSGRVNWKQRSLGDLLGKARSGDTIVFAEISRIARSTLQVLEVLEFCQRKEITVYVAKQKMVLDNSMQSTITATVLGLAAEIEKEFISLRTIESLNKLKAEGVKLGRPKGSRSNVVKLDAYKDDINRYLKLGLNKTAIAKLVNCAPNTLYSWLDRHNLRSA